MPLDVIGAGLGRTGTLSLKAALESLGFSKCYHMTEVLAHPDHVRLWDGAARGEPVDWEALFQGYRATVDWPGCNFYQDLMRTYPDAKVILTVRDPERWYESARQTIYYVRHAFPPWLTAALPRMRVMQRMIDRLVWVGMFRGKFDDRPFAIEVFERHNAEVRRVVPPDRLLVYQVGEGWEPLCAFLGVPVPADTPFPRLNDTASFRSWVGKNILLVKAGAYGFLGLAALALAWLAIRRVR